MPLSFEEFKKEREKERKQQGILNSTPASTPKPSSPATSGPMTFEEFKRERSGAQTQENARAYEPEFPVNKSPVSTGASVATAEGDRSRNNNDPKWQIKEQYDAAVEDKKEARNNFLTQLTNFGPVSGTYSDNLKAAYNAWQNQRQKANDLEEDYKKAFEDYREAQKDYNIEKLKADAGSVLLGNIPLTIALAKYFSDTYDYLNGKSDTAPKSFIEDYHITPEGREAAKRYAAQGGDPSSSVIGSGYLEMIAPVSDALGYVGQVAGIKDAEKLREFADKAQNLEAQWVADQKTSRGEAGQFGVDVGVQAVPLIADTALTYASGGGSAAAKAALATRAFGGGTMEARKGGGSLVQQGLYGAGSAAVELITEKMFDAFGGKVYGASAMDDVINHWAGKTFKSPAARAAAKYVVEAAGEGIEEVTSDVINPILKSIYNDKSIVENYKDMFADFDSVVYDFAIGAALGAVGGSTNVVSQMTGNISAQEAFFMDAGREGKTFAQAAAEWEALESSGKVNAENVAPSDKDSSRAAGEQEAPNRPTTPPATQSDVKLGTGELNAEPAEEMPDGTFASEERLRSVAEQEKEAERGAIEYADSKAVEQEAQTPRSPELTDAEIRKLDSMAPSQIQLLFERWDARAEAAKKMGGAGAEYAEARLRFLNDYIDARVAGKKYKRDTSSQFTAEDKEATKRVIRESAEESARIRKQESERLAQKAKEDAEKQKGLFLAADDTWPGFPRSDFGFLGSEWDDVNEDISEPDHNTIYTFLYNGHQYSVYPTGKEKNGKAWLIEDIDHRNLLSAKADAPGDALRKALYEETNKRTSQESAKRAGEKAAQKQGAELLAEQANESGEKRSQKQPSSYDPATAFEQRDIRAADLRKRISDTKDKDLLKVSKTHFDYAKADIKDFDKGRKIIGRSSFGSNNQEILEAHLFLINAISEELEKRGLSWADVVTRDGENAQITKRKIKGLTDQLTRRLTNRLTGADILAAQAKGEEGDVQNISNVSSGETKERNSPEQSEGIRRDSGGSIQEGNAERNRIDEERLSNSVKSWGLDDDGERRRAADIIRRAHLLPNYDNYARKASKRNREDVINHKSFNRSLNSNSYFAFGEDAVADALYVIAEYAGIGADFVVAKDSAGTSMGETSRSNKIFVSYNNTVRTGINPVTTLLHESLHWWMNKAVGFSDAFEEYRKARDADDSIAGLKAARKILRGEVAKDKFALELASKVIPDSKERNRLLGRFSLAYYSSVSQMDSLCRQIATLINTAAETESERESFSSEDAKAVRNGTYAEELFANLLSFYDIDDMGISVSSAKKYRTALIDAILNNEHTKKSRSKLSNLFELSNSLLGDTYNNLNVSEKIGELAENFETQTSEAKKVSEKDGKVTETGDALDLNSVPDKKPDYSRDEAEFQAMQEKADREKADAAREAREKKNEDRHKLDEDVKELIEEDRRQPNLTGFKKEQNKIEKIERELGGKQSENADEYNEMMAKEAGGKARDLEAERWDRVRKADKDTPTSAEAERNARKKERVDKVVSEEEAKANFDAANRFFGAHHRAVMDAAKNVSDLETFIDKGDYASFGNKRDQAAAKTLSDFRSQMNGVANGSDDIADLFYTYETFKNSTVLSEFYDADVQRMIDSYNRHADERSPSYNPDVLAEESARIMSLMAYRMKQANEWHDIGVELNSTIGSKMSKAARKLAKSKSLTASLARAFVRWQINPDTVFKMIDGFSGNKNSAGYKLAQELKDGVKKHYEVLLNARSHFNDLVNQDGYLDFAFGKEKIKDSEGREWDARTAVDLIRGVQTLLSTSEEKIDGIKGFALKQDDGSYEYIDFGEPSGPEGAMNYDNAGAEAIKLAKELSGKLSKVAKNYSEAASKAFGSVTEDLKRVYRENVGEDIGMMGDFKEDSVYHPVWWKSPDSDDTVKWTIRDSLEGRWTPRFLHSRSETGGAYLVVRPVTDTIQNYFDQASNYIAYSAFANKMNFLNRDAEHKASLSRSLAEAYGKDMGNWMTNYVKDISSFFNEEDTDGINALLRKSRRAIQQGALLFSVSVPMKQISSYWAASSVLHMDSLARAYRVKILKPLNSPGADVILASRRLGNYDQSAYEAQQDAKKGFGKLKYKYPFINWASNTISMMDYNTVSNLLTATEYDVLKYQFGGDKSQIGTEEYNKAVKDLFQEVVLRSQPIFDKQMRAEYGRTDNEIIRMTSMFRTQQTQNLNLIATAIGEYMASKGNGNEAKATERLRQTLGGQIASALSLSVLSVLADFALHKLKKYRDDDEEDKPVTAAKVLERIGINAVASASGTVWFGDTLAKWAIDQLSGGKTNEFYGVNMGVVTTLSNVIDAVGNVVQQPTRSNVKYAAGQISTMLGVPLNNAYSILNSAIMYAKDVTGSNEGNYDDILRYLDAKTKAAKKAEEKSAKEVAKAFSKSGADVLAEAARQNSSQSELNSAQAKNESSVSGWKTKQYDALIGAGMSSERSVEVLTAMDTDHNDSIKQSEMLAYYKAHPEDEKYIIAMWNSYGYKTTWEAAKAKAK